jgi:hypothetical protein
VIGDQNKRREEASTQSRQAGQPQPAQAAGYATGSSVPVVYASQQDYLTGQALGRLVGQWRITGSIDAGDGKMLPVSGTGTGAVERKYFVRLDLRFTDPRTGQPVEGTGMISQTGGRGLEMSNSFSTSPEVRLFKGSMDQSGTIFSLSQFDPPAPSRRLTIRLSAGRGWTADVWNDDKRVESYTFEPM